MTDSIDHPSHYNSRNIGYECIDFAEPQTFCVGNAIKYLWRYKSKGKPLEDLQKARWYAQRALMLGDRILICDNACDKLVKSTKGLERVAWEGFAWKDWHMVIEALDRMIERLENGKEA